MSELYYSNIQLEEDTEYFLYIGELKNYGLSTFLQEAMSRITQRRVAFIAIVPDVLEQYSYDNLLVINPLWDDYACRFGNNVSCRISSREFMRCVSESRHVKELIRLILDSQEQLYIYLYESLPEMTLDELPGVSILGPDKRTAARLNSKIYQFRRFQSRLPMPEGKLCAGWPELRRTTSRLWERWTDGIFITGEYSAAGGNSQVAYGPEDIDDRFKASHQTCLINRYMPHAYDPTVLAVVAGEDEVFVAGVADQRIEGGTRFTGSTFPSVLDKTIQDQLSDYTRRIGRELAQEGYRGIFGCDFIVTDDGNILFLEVNARKQGTTMEFCCTLEQSLPAGAPTLPELEYHAVVHGRFPAGIAEMTNNPKGIHWGTYNYKIHNNVRTSGYLPNNPNEREAFQNLADYHRQKDFLILEHVGSDFIVAEGSFLARIVSLGKDTPSVQQGLDQGLKTIRTTIDENLSGEA